jgi:predicted aldo/keto reductase-like oxidoreductase
MTCPSCGGELRDRVVRVRWTIVLALYAVGLGLAWWLTGNLLHDIIEGLDRSRLPLWELAVPLIVLLGAVTAALRRRRRPVCEQCGAGALLAASAAPAAAERRRFLRVVGAGGAAAATVAAGGVAAVVRNRGWIPIARDFFQTKVETTSPSPRPEWAGARIRSYRRLGRTNAMVSDISVGSGHIRNVEIAIRAIERGVTYFDTAPDYADAGSEQVLGQAFKGRRDKLFIATKFCLPQGHLLNDTPVPDAMAAVEASLRRLQTDHVDLIHIHSCDRVERLLAPNIHEAFDRLKEQGKVRFLGVSTHTPNLEEVANAAIDSGRFDVMMLAYHFGMWKSFGHILEKAKQHDVGIVAMKTLKGAAHTNLAQFRDEAGAYSQAAFRWVLSNPNVSCLVVSFSQLQHCDEYIAASGTAPQPSDQALLERYDVLTAGDYCQPHCGVCLDACPNDLPINDVLRHRMYFRDYRQEKEAMRLYAKLDRDASACAACPAPCAGACPIGVPIREKMVDAHRLLSFGGASAVLS